jgi:hypothetical protein
MPLFSTRCYKQFKKHHLSRKFRNICRYGNFVDTLFEKFDNFNYFSNDIMNQNGTKIRGFVAEPSPRDQEQWRMQDF